MNATEAMEQQSLLEQQLRDEYKDRYAKFWVSRELMERQPFAVAELLKGLVVVRADMGYVWNAMEYEVMGPVFPRLERGARIPIWIPTIYVMYTNDAVSQSVHWRHEDEAQGQSPIVNFQHYVHADVGIDFAKGHLALEAARSEIDEKRNPDAWDMIVKKHKK